MGSKSNDKRLQQRRKDTDREGELTEEKATWRQGIGVVSLQVKESQGMPAAASSEERGMEKALLENLRASRVN